MATRHGRVARTAVSRQDPQTLEFPRTPELAPELVSNGRETATRDELGRLAAALLDNPTYQQKWRQDLALARILEWLETFPGEDWQERWLLSGSDHAVTSGDRRTTLRPCATDSPPGWAS